MLILFVLALFLAVMGAALLLTTKGARAWKTVAEGDLIDVRFIDYAVPEPPYFYSQDHMVMPRCETILRFADGTEFRMPGALMDHARRGQVRIQRNWLGLYRFEPPPP